ncbi:FAD-binding protein, partial [Vibrio cholerae]|uniref:FAD-binding protein n=1 Tax=Vibrio cholerae TaxID=666 RepID=UPI0026516D12
MFFIKNFSGTVLLNRIMGITSTEDSAAWYLHVGAGENWHQLVCHSLQNNMPGLENLALIPGCVGSAPIQNIGAYGVELKQVCEYVDLLDMDKG